MSLRQPDDASKQQGRERDTNRTNLCPRCQQEVPVGTSHFNVDWGGYICHPKNAPNQQPTPSADEEIERITDPKPEDIRKWLEFYHDESFRLGTTNEGAKSTVVGLLRELALLTRVHANEREDLKAENENLRLHHQYVCDHRDSLLKDKEQFIASALARDKKSDEDRNAYESLINELKAQLEAARAQCELRSAGHDDLRTRLNQANTQLSALQSELATAQRERDEALLCFEDRVSLRSQLQTAQEKLAEANAKLAEAEKERNKVKQMYSDLVIEIRNLP